MSLWRADHCLELNRIRRHRRLSALASGGILSAFVTTVSAAVQQGQLGSSKLVAVPENPDWAKYVLLAVIWTLVIAAVIGPIYRFLLRKTTASDSIKYRGW
ncbi:MAG: hypothetical protein ACP5QA_08840 [Phycisphaerae bacterium]